VVTGTYTEKGVSVLEKVFVRTVNCHIAYMLRPAGSGGKAVGS
jgi:hypothetical protein